MRYRVLAVCLASLGVAACDPPGPVSSARAATPTPVGAPAPDAMTAELRTMWLKLQPADTGSVLPPGKHVYGASFEMNLGPATATIVTHVDGSTSLYLSSGGGTIGAGDHAAVRAASERLIAVAESSLSLFAAASDHAYPAEGQAHFYALTDRGLLRAGPVSLDEVEADPAHALRPLYEAGQDLLTQIRLVNERMDTSQ